jgi:hypothetical protein
VFLKLLVLLVPREMQIEHKGGVKAKTDEQLETGIEAIQAMLAAAKVIDSVPGPQRCRHRGLPSAGCGPRTGCYRSYSPQAQDPSLAGSA